MSIMSSALTARETNRLHRWAMWRMTVNEGIISCIRDSGAPRLMYPEDAPSDTSSLTAASEVAEFQQFPFITAEQMSLARELNLREKYGSNHGLSDDAYFIFGLPRINVGKDIPEVTSTGTRSVYECFSELGEAANGHGGRLSMTYSEVGPSPDDRSLASGHNNDVEVQRINGYREEGWKSPPLPVPRLNLYSIQEELNYNNSNTGEMTNHYPSHHDRDDPHSERTNRYPSNHHSEGDTARGSYSLFHRYQDTEAADRRYPPSRRYSAEEETANRHSSNRYPEEETANRYSANRYPKEETANRYSANRYPGEETANRYSANRYPEEETANRYSANRYPEEETANRYSANRYPEEETVNRYSANRYPEEETANRYSAKRYPEEETANRYSANRYPEEETANRYSAKRYPEERSHSLSNRYLERQTTTDRYPSSRYQERDTSSHFTSNRGYHDSGEAVIPTPSYSVKEAIDRYESVNQYAATASDPIYARRKISSTSSDRFNQNSRSAPQSPGQHDIIYPPFSHSRQNSRSPTRRSYSPLPSSPRQSYSSSPTSPTSPSYSRQSHVPFPSARTSSFPSGGGGEGGGGGQGVGSPGYGNKMRPSRLLSDGESEKLKRQAYYDWSTPTNERYRMDFASATRYLS